MSKSRKSLKKKERDKGSLNIGKKINVRNFCSNVEKKKTV